MPDPISLEQIFGAFVRQETLEDAALEMAGLAKGDPQLVGELQGALLQGIATTDGELLVKAVHRSGYRVTGPEQARTYCSELLNLFNARLSNEP